MDGQHDGKKQLNLEMESICLTKTDFQINPNISRTIKRCKKKVQKSLWL